MKNMARLVLFFSLTFIIIFVIAGAICYIELALGAAKTIPAGPPAELGALIDSLQKILPLILYISILLGLSYTARRGMAMPAAMVGLFILAGGAILGSSLGLIRLKTLGSAVIPLVSPTTLGSPGLILSQGDTVMVVLGAPAAAGSPRAVLIPGRPLIYQPGGQEQPSGPNHTAAVLPPAPFRTGESPMMTGFLVDSALVAGQFTSRLDQGRGLVPFALYGGALILLLVSLRFVLNLSSWPLANLFSGALVFRGILAFQTFIDSRFVQDAILDFANGRLSGALISPVIFAGIAVLILLYTFLVSLAIKVRAPKPQDRRTHRRRAGD